MDAGFTTVWCVNPIRYAYLFVAVLVPVRMCAAVTTRVVR
ncbi:hypothetical protein Rhow_009066 [Rhodococcus wratislaviensis]|uniref:Uncharacterized protein n=1 Tax=Rhodococcus wratislaviensis TaxID=44752 RepID=A0A402CM84_RHOWR|nr:hypothetical protein Rhow_009066 [Rhodococcus wratislaviensis]